MTTLTPNDKKILRRIREKVVSTHWVKGDYHRIQKTGKAKGKEKCCLVGFVNVETLPEGAYHQGDPGIFGSRTIYGLGGAPVAKPRLERRDRILDALRSAVVKHTRHPLNNIESFNDAKNTKRQDVLDVIDIALGDKP